MEMSGGIRGMLRCLGDGVDAKGHKDLVWKEWLALRRATRMQA